MSQSTPINLIRRGNDNSVGSSSPFGGSDNTFQQEQPYYQQQHQQLMPPNQQDFTNPTNKMMSMQPQQQNFADTQLVEDILKEFGDSPGSENQGAINTQAFQYATDRAQVPAYKYESNPAESIDNFTNNQSNNFANGGGGNDNSFLGQVGLTLSPGNLKDRISNSFKFAILVFVICFLLSLPEFNRFLFGFFPRLLLESGQVSLGGVLLKAAIGMVVFSIIGLFL